MNEANYKNKKYSIKFLKLNKKKLIFLLKMHSLLFD